MTTVHGAELQPGATATTDVAARHRRWQRACRAIDHVYGVPVGADPVVAAVRHARDILRRDARRDPKGNLTWHSATAAIREAALLHGADAEAVVDAINAMKGAGP